MPVTGASYSEAIREVAVETARELRTMAKAAPELWLTTARVRSATQRAAAPRSTWYAQQRFVSPGVVTIDIGWRDFPGDAAARFQKSVVIYDALLENMTRNMWGAR